MTCFQNVTRFQGRIENVFGPRTKIEGASMPLCIYFTVRSIWMILLWILQYSTLDTLFDEA